MKLYTIFFKTKNYNPYRRYYQNTDRYTKSISIKGSMQDVMNKIKELSNNGNIHVDTIKVYDNTGKVVC